MYIRNRTGHYGERLFWDFVVITNPVDVMTYYVQKLSGLPSYKVIGTGTALNSAGLKYHLADVMGVDPQIVHAGVPAVLNSQGEKNWWNITCLTKKWLT